MKLSNITKFFNSVRRLSDEHGYLVHISADDRYQYFNVVLDKDDMEQFKFFTVPYTEITDCKDPAVLASEKFKEFIFEKDSSDD